MWTNFSSHATCFCKAFCFPWTGIFQQHKGFHQTVWHKMYISHFCPNHYILTSFSRSEKQENQSFLPSPFKLTDEESWLSLLLLLTAVTFSEIAVTSQCHSRYSLQCVKVCLCENSDKGEHWLVFYAWREGLRIVTLEFCFAWLAAVVVLCQPQVIWHA